MFTSLDKALIATVMGVLSILNLTMGFSLGVPAETISAVIAALTPVLVYMIPNKKVAPSQ